MTDDEVVASNVPPRNMFCIKCCKGSLHPRNSMFGSFRLYDRPSVCPSVHPEAIQKKTPKNEILAQKTIVLWDKTRSFWDIQSFTFPKAREWAKWVSKQMSERSGARDQSEQGGASERVSGASEKANGRASGPVL